MPNDEQPQQPDRHQRTREREVEERQRAPQAPGQPELRARHARDPVVALGQRHPAEGESPDDHAERERDHQEVSAGGADGDETKDGGGHGGGHDTDDEADQESRLTLGGEDGDGVRGHAEVGGVAERGQAGEAEEHVEAHGEDRHDQRLGQQRQRIRRQPRRDACGDDGHDDHARNRAGTTKHHARPKRPVGLNARMRAIGANRVKYDSSGKSALPKLSRRPTSKLPTIAPGRLPSPPTMTTTNA